MHFYLFALSVGISGLMGIRGIVVFVKLAGAIGSIEIMAFTGTEAESDQKGEKCEAIHLRSHKHLSVKGNPRSPCGLPF